MFTPFARIQGSMVYTDLLRITIRRKFVREKQGLGDSQDGSFVTLVYAENQTHAAQRVKQIRRERGLK
jgi:hypothetical protein